MALVGAGSGSLWAAVVLACACSAPRPLTTQPVTAPVLTEPETAEAVVLAPGDALDIKLFYTPDLNEQVTIRPDGQIGLQLVGEVQAAGHTPEELRRLLTGLYAQHLKQPDVTVIVRSLQDQRVYVGGEVRSPQVVSLTGRLTALQAIFQSGGALPTAHLGQVLVLRYRGQEAPQVVQVDLQSAVQSGSGDVSLRPYDVVYVPKTAIAKADQFVEQYINQIIPRSVSFPFNYFFNSSVENLR